MERRRFIKSLGVGFACLCLNPFSLLKPKKAKVEYQDITKTIDEYMFEAISKGTSVHYQKTGFANWHHYNRAVKLNENWIGRYEQVRNAL